MKVQISLGREQASGVSARSRDSPEDMGSKVLGKCVSWAVPMREGSSWQAYVCARVGGSKNCGFSQRP